MTFPHLYPMLKRQVKKLESLRTGTEEKEQWRLRNVGNMHAGEEESGKDYTGQNDLYRETFGESGQEVRAQSNVWIGESKGNKDRKGKFTRERPFCCECWYDIYVPLQ